MLDSGMIELLIDSIWETLFMVIVSSILAYVIGLPIGVVLNITNKNGICPNKPINAVLGVLVNIFRSVPFLILLIWIQPITRMIVGTTEMCIRDSLRTCYGSRLTGCDQKSCI